MSASIAQRVGLIRESLKQHQIDAFIIPRADEYLGEYVPEKNERLLWATGFTGSAGMAIILQNSAAIFTDGRYTVQVRQQVSGDIFQYLGLAEDPQIEWLIETLPAGSKVGIDTRLHTLAWVEQAKAKLNKAELTLVEIANNPIDQHWHDRPAAATTPVMLFSHQGAGRNSVEKRQQIADIVKKQGADAALITALDSFCWLLNLRGGDVPRLPVLLGTALLFTNGEVILFTDINKLPQGTMEHVGAGVSFKTEAELEQTLLALGNIKLLADPFTANAWSQLTAIKGGCQLIAGADPIALPKAQKNSAELAGMYACHIRDGAAVTRFLAWLDAQVAQGNMHDEAVLADQLESYRLMDPLYKEPSFDTISATGANAAMCHYNHNNGTPSTMTKNSLYLVDSGAQYLDGTTDVTRTIAIGDVSAQHKKMVTLVLKGHIALDLARFPKGTTGQQLDSFARQYLWQHGFDFDHGTGHGVGHFLSVHEGPQRIGKNANNVALVAGMVLSNEPGYYREDAFGIRIENLVAVQKCQALAGAEREMYEFDALTLIPIDKRLIDTQLLTTAEINWVNQYHQKVAQTLSPLLEGDDKAWLTQATQAI
ncbi:aminopeptidase P family protein [Shewanella intestini]|uniref:Aminopeptidase P family protein n=1 Tax=Shewanella intestini TaxID=2017544 RepID=A0ABS5HXT3_9GAMM|nr:MULTISPECIES: aminopeptidase P family protein [Shewanella]MBR9726570.1 aminopeptidase P family protein [Shewanella intestini]MRG34864.1 M24 family metallopeptidase [Shewanella sp. XMDDZSB0408]